MIKSVIFDLVGTLYDDSADELYRDALPTLNELKNRFGLVLVTDIKNNKECLIRNLGIYDIFDKVVIDQKNKEVLKEILRQSNLHPSECIVVGDGATNELKIANELNIKSIQINRDKTFKEDNQRISSLSKIAGIIDSHNKNNTNKIIDQREIILKDSNNKKYMISVYLKEVLVRNNNYNIKAFCKIMKI